MSKLNQIVILLFMAGCLALLITGCDKAPDNPFDNQGGTDPTDPEPIPADLGTIEGLHARIFAPTCANSGCHDGTFEPDFRTIESTYNTLVYHPIIKNDPMGSYQYRVVPGNPDASVLMARLTYDIDNNSGLMPLVVDPGAEWNTKSEEFIQALRTWIQNGAKDIFGQSYNLQDAVPTMHGVIAESNGIYMERNDAGQGAFRVPQNVTQLSVYFSLLDDKTLPQNLTVNEIKFADGPDAFAGKPVQNLEVLATPITYKGYYGPQVQYTHKIVINPQQMAVLNQTVYFRIYVKDNVNPVTEIPTNAGVYYIKNYFSFTIVE